MFLKIVHWRVLKRLFVLTLPQIVQWSNGPWEMRRDTRSQPNQGWSRDWCVPEMITIIFGWQVQCLQILPPQKEWANWFLTNTSDFMSVLIAKHSLNCTLSSCFLTRDTTSPVVLILVKLVNLVPLRTERFWLLLACSSYILQSF